jgi:hypothetical protein
MVNPFVTKGYAGPAYFCDSPINNKEERLAPLYYI